MDVLGSVRIDNNCSLIFLAELYANDNDDDDGDGGHHHLPTQVVQSCYRKNIRSNCMIIVHKIAAARLKESVFLPSISIWITNIQTYCQSVWQVRKVDDIQYRYQCSAHAENQNRTFWEGLWYEEWR